MAFGTRRAVPAGQGRNAVAPEVFPARQHQPSCCRPDAPRPDAPRVPSHQRIRPFKCSRAHQHLRQPLPSHPTDACGAVPAGGGRRGASRAGPRSGPPRASQCRASAAARPTSAASRPRRAPRAGGAARRRRRALRGPRRAGWRCTRCARADTLHQVGTDTASLCGEHSTCEHRHGFGRRATNPPRAGPVRASSAGRLSAIPRYVTRPN